MRIRNQTFSILWKAALLLVGAYGLLDGSGLLRGHYAPAFPYMFTNISNMFAWVYFLLALICQVVLTVKLIRNAAGMRNKTGFLPTVAALVVLALGVYVGIRPEVFPNDAWYYGLACGCLLGILLNALFTIGRYNDLVTRPVPNFFRREGANNARS